jgi:hypothetical protein
LPAIRITLAIQHSIRDANSMSHAVSPAAPKSVVLERRPHWCKETDLRQSVTGQPAVDAHCREATIAFSVLSWPSMRIAVARPNAPPAEQDAIASDTSDRAPPGARENEIPATK